MSGRSLGISSTNPLEFWYSLGEPIETRQPRVFLFREPAICYAFRSRRLRIWLRRKDCIVAIQATFCSIVDFKTSLQLRGNRLRFRFRRFAARLHLDQRLSTDGRRAALSNRGG